MTFLNFFSHIIHPNYSFPSLHTSQCPPIFPLPQLYSSSIFLQERADLPEISIEHDITGYNKTRHKLL